MHAAAPRLPVSMVVHRLSAWCLVALTLAAPSAVGQSDAGSPGGDQSTVETLFGDFVHYARLGKFELAEATATQLLGRPDLDPVNLLAVSERDPGNLELLILLIDNSSIGQTAARVLEVIQQGEFQLRQDVARIKSSIEKLGGPPQVEFHAVQRLVDSGEYAVPWLLQTLSDPTQERLHPRIVAALPKLGRSAINPLVAALASEDQTLRGHTLRALGRIGYPQAVPHLQLALIESGATPEIKAVAAEAIGRIEQRSGHYREGSPATQFFRLAEQFYDERGSVAADPRLSTANVWHWNAEDEFLEHTLVPQRIFGPVMAMRCCQRALQLEPGNDDVIALWLAANIRRESRLGLDVESAEPGVPDEVDDTRPEDFPPSLYFTRAAGARYAHMVLGRAVDDRDASVALGAIAALRSVAGTASLIGSRDHQQPLVRALEFPDRVVRIQAALVLGNALPRSPFVGAERVVPVLAGALDTAQGERLVLVEPDADNRNRLAADLRQSAAQVVAEADFYKAMERSRAELDWVTAFVLSADLDAPGLAAAVQSLRREAAFASTPIILLTGSGTAPAAEALAGQVAGVGHVSATADRGQIVDLLDRMREESGSTALDSEAALDLAFDAASTLQRIATDGATVLNCGAAEAALIAALSTADEELRMSCMSVLALMPTPTAQRAIADAALQADNSETLRQAAFSALAESARRGGNRLDDQRLSGLLTAARQEPDIAMRTAASQALGAINLADNKASEIIRSFWPG